MGRGLVAVLVCFAGVAVGVGVLVPRLPSPFYGVLAVLGASAAALSVALARAGRTLDPAFVALVATMLHVPWALAGLQGILPPATAIVGLAPFVVAALWIRPQARRQTLLLAPLVLLALLAAVSLAWSSDPAYGGQKLSLWLFAGLMPAAFVLVLGASSKRISWALILAVTVAISGYFLLMAAPTGEYGSQPTVVSWNPIWSARVAYVGAIVALFGPFPRWVRVLTLPILLMHGWATDSLGPAAGLALGAGAGLIEMLRLRESGSRRASVGLLGIWLVVGAGLLVFLGGLIEPALSPLMDDGNVTGRADLLAIAPSLFISSPVVGTGLGDFAASGTFALYPHNLPVEIGVELGVLGLLALLAWWLLALRGSIGSPLLVALLVATSVFSLFSGNLASNEAFWLVSGLAVARFPLGRRRQERQHRHDLTMTARVTRLT